MTVYRGRFAPSPTGPLHAGSLAAALASWLDARAHQGQWLIRMEDVDEPRCIPGADTLILKQLSDCGLHSDLPVVWQSRRAAHYAHALSQLLAQSWVYGCQCSRKDIENQWLAHGVRRERHQAWIYPGTCRALNLTPDSAHAELDWRFKVAPGMLSWHDRWLGSQKQDVAAEVGDFVLKRADGLWAYQLAVVVDDGLQGITDVVRGQDLADNTPRQILLQRALGLPLPRYAHLPLVRDAQGEKLSKQQGAQPLDTQDPLKCLNAAAIHLGLAPQSGTVSDALLAWTRLIHSSHAKLKT
jgi:glutamyl-Q tRNA(Asp) synthetase